MCVCIILSHLWEGAVGLAYFSVSVRYFQKPVPRSNILRWCEVVARLSRKLCKLCRVVEVLIALMHGRIVLHAPFDIGLVFLLENFIVFVQILEVRLRECCWCHNSALLFLEFVHFTWIVT